MYQCFLVIFLVERGLEVGLLGGVDVSQLGVDLHVTALHFILIFRLVVRGFTFPSFVARRIEFIPGLEILKIIKTLIIASSPAVCAAGSDLVGKAASHTSLLHHLPPSFAGGGGTRGCSIAGMLVDGRLQGALLFAILRGGGALDELQMVQEGGVVVLRAGDRGHAAAVLAVHQAERIRGAAGPHTRAVQRVIQQVLLILSRLAGLLAAPDARVLAR